MAIQFYSTPQVISPLSIATTSPLPNATLGVPYSYSLVALGGLPPYTWSITSDSPDTGNWLSISNAGSLSGTPETTETESVTIKVRDSSGQSASKAFSLTVTGNALAFTTTSPLPSGTVGVAYSASLGATGGVPPYTFSLVSDPGSTNTWGVSAAQVFGTPTTAETDTLNIKVTDSASPTPASVTQAFSLPVFSASGLPVLTLIPSQNNANGPWTFGQGFPPGAVPAGSRVGASSGASAIQNGLSSYWPDGSLKHTVLSGLSGFTNGKASRVQLIVTSAAASGPNVPEPTTANIPLGAFQVQFTAGSGSFPTGNATADLSSALGASSTWSVSATNKLRSIPGQLMSEFHYWVPVGISPGQTAVIFMVRAYTNGAGGIGAICVKTVVENGLLNAAGPSEADYNVAIVINGTTTFSQAISHYSHTRWGHVDWYSGGAPVTPQHDPSYLRLTKLVPNFGYTNASTATLQGFVTQSVNPQPYNVQGTYPFQSLGDFGWTYGYVMDAGIGGFGGNDWLGILPQWESLYCTTGNAYAYRATIGNTALWGNYFHHYRDETTGRVPLYSSYPHNSFNSGWQPAFPVGAGTQGGGLDIAHLPSCGYLAYLIEGWWDQLEEVNWGAYYLIQNTNPATSNLSTGLLSCLNSPVTTRAMAWGMRNAAMAAAVFPTSFGDGGGTVPTADTALYQSMVNIVQSTVANMKACYIDGSIDITGTTNLGSNGGGWIGQEDSYASTIGDASGWWWGGAFQVGFQAQVFGFINDIQPAVSNPAQLLAVRNFVWQEVTQKLQSSDIAYAPVWNFRHAGNYITPYLAPSGTPQGPIQITQASLSAAYSHFSSFYSFATPETANPGDPLFISDGDTLLTSTGSSRLAGQGYWAIVLGVAAQAAEAGVPYAKAQYNNILLSANNAGAGPVAAGADNFPNFTFAPRSAAAPAWYPSTAGTWTTIPGSSLSGSGVLQAADINVMADWGGGSLNLQGIYIGSVFHPGVWLLVTSTGHTDSGTGVYAYGPVGSGNEAWYRLRDSVVPAPVNVQTDASGNPVARHVYDGAVWLPNQNRHFLGGQFRYTDTSNPGQQFYDACFPSPNSGQPWIVPPQSPNGDPLCTVYDPLNDCVWCWNQLYNIGQYFPHSNTWVGTNNGYLTYNHHNAVSALDTKRGIWAIWLGASSSTSYSFALLFYNTSTGTITNSVYQPTIANPSAGPPLNDGTLLYDKGLDAFVFYQGGNALWALTPPATNPYNGGNPWTWSSMSVSGSAPPAWPINGIYKRFCYVDSPNAPGYLLVPTTTDSSYFFRST